MIVPARDAAGTIAEQLSALAGQDYRGSWEVVVVDNGSVDATNAVAGSWSDRLPGLRVIAASDGRGASFARNAGVAAATGDLLAFCDADDVVDGRWLTGVVTAARDRDMVGGPLDLDRLNDPAVRAWIGSTPPKDRLVPVLDFLPAAYSGNCGVWRSVLHDVGGWNTDYQVLEDFELSWRVQLASFDLGFAADAVVHYRMCPDLNAYSRKAYRNAVESVRLFREFRGHGVPRTSTRRALRVWAGLVRRLPELLASRARRGAYLRSVAIRAGRVAGSIRYRTLLP